MAVTGSNDEQALFAQSLAGDLTAFNRLLAPHQQIAFSLASRLLNDPQQAQKALAHSCALAFHHLADFGNVSLIVWFLRIVVDICREWQAATTPSLAAPDVGLWGGDRRLARAFRSLAFEDRLVLLLADVHGFSHQTIAEVCATTRMDVAARVGRARGRLAGALHSAAGLLPTGPAVSGTAVDALGGTDPRFR